MVLAYLGGCNVGWVGVDGLGWESQVGFSPEDVVLDFHINNGPFSLFFKHCRFTFLLFIVMDLIGEPD
jgi:hypothetical protein